MPSNLMAHVRPVRPEPYDQFMPSEDEQLPWQRSMAAGQQVLRAGKRVDRAVVAMLLMPIGFGVAWLPWPAWVAVGVALVGYLVTAIVLRLNAKTAQVTVMAEAERGIKIVEPRDEDEGGVTTDKESAA